MISPPESTPFHPSTLRVTPLFAILAYVDHDGNPQVIEGKIGRLIQGPATELSEGTLWALKNGEVVQAYQKGLDLSRFENPEDIDFRDDDGSEIDRDALSKAQLVVTGFKHGVPGARRGKFHGTERILSGMEAFRSLILLSDEALDHAIGTNLKSDVSVRQHNENIRELKALIDSKGELADEIRTFLEKMSSAKDKINRHNVYRMVLIVRAIQRRAKALKDQKETTLQAITKTGLDISRYIGAVTELAARIITELSDEQPWWIEGKSGNLKPYVATRRRENFRSRLEQYCRELHAITANPFTAWAMIADSALFYAMRGENVLENTRKATDAMQVILAREKLSRAVMDTQLDVAVQEEEEQQYLDLLNDLYIYVASVIGTEQASKVSRFSNMSQYNIALRDIPKALRIAEDAFDGLFEK
ncbi:MAG: hypothetical protein WCT28_03925 [Patescibacteria group bacterium]|jgi:hypothetical protein